MPEFVIHNGIDADSFTAVITSEPFQENNLPKSTANSSVSKLNKFNSENTTFG